MPNETLYKPYYAQGDPGYPVVVYHSFGSVSDADVEGKPDYR